jgi:hypothetical protein
MSLPSHAGDGMSSPPSYAGDDVAEMLLAMMLLMTMPT